MADNSLRKREQILELKQEDHFGHVMVHLQSFYDEGVLCDVTLRAGDYSVKAHKVVLAANSDYFQAMFSGNWTEKGDGDIVLHGVTPCGLKSVVQFSYFGKLLVSSETIVDVVSAVHHCQMIKAYELCEEFLSDGLDESNFFELLKLSDAFSLEILCQNLVEFVVKVFMPSSSGDKEVLDINSHLYLLEPWFFKLVIKQWKLCESGFGYFAALDLVTKWAKFNFQERESYLPELFTILNRKVGEIGVPDVAAVLEHCNTTTQDRMLDAEMKGFGFITFMYGDEPAVYHEHDEGTDSWRHLAKFPCQELLYDSFGVSTLNNCLYVCGGCLCDPMNSALDTCRKYDPFLDRWLQISPLQDARKFFPLVTLPDQLLALGGLDRYHTILETVEVYSLTNSTWSESVPLPQALTSHAATVHAGKIYVSGGVAEHCGDALGSLLCFDPIMNTWTYKKRMIAARCKHFLVAHNYKLYQLGGENSEYGIVRVPLAEYYDIVTNSWTRLNIFQDDMHTYPYGACVQGNLFYIWFEVMLGVPQRVDTLYVVTFDPENKITTKVYECSSWMRVGAKHLCPVKFPMCVLNYMPVYSSRLPVNEALLGFM